MIDLRLSVSRTATILATTEESGGGGGGLGGGGGSTVITQEGKIVVGPAVYGHRWEIQAISVNTTSADASECRVYKGSVSPQNMLVKFDNGNDGRETLGSIVLETGDYLTFLWTGGTEGATCVVIMEGRIRGGK